MKLRLAIALIAAAALLTACNFTLAADVTPPPGYVPPTPLPTMGPLYPPSAPDIEHGAAIYAEKCAACHGATGLGDGEQGKQLPVTVAAFALPETAQKATPAQWFTTVTQGNIERFMPPFTGSLSEQDRWDVIAYALTLHATPDQVQKGKTIFEEKCADCAKTFSNQEKMAALSEDDLVRLIKSGEGDIPAFGAGLSDDDAYAVAAYLRTLTFASVEVAQSVPTAAAITPAGTSASGTPSAEQTPVEGTPQAEAPTEASPVAGIGTVSGKVDNQTGAALPEGMKVTLHEYDHGGDPNAGPQEIAKVETTLDANGAYSFENMEIPENRIFVAEVEQEGITYQSDFVIVKAGDTQVTVPDIKLYGTTTDLSNLVVDVVSMHFNYANETDPVQVIMVYTMRNAGDKTIIVKVDNTKQEIPFIKAPANAGELGFQVMQDSATFYSTQGGDAFAMPPTEKPYGLVVFTDLPASKKLEFSQQFVLPVAKINVLTPEGVTVSGDNFSNEGTTSMQDANGKTVNFQAYSTGSVKAGDSLTFTVSGKPKGTSGATSLAQNQTLLIGVGIFGLVLILAGVWMYVRDRNRIKEEEADEEAEFDDTDSVLDAIIALDDLHRAGKLNDEAYRKRRDELKAKLKE